MADYFLTKSPNLKTGELPDLVVVDLTPAQGWTVAKDILNQLQACNPRVTLNIYCQVTRTDRLMSKIEPR